jgi:hypothetical protein
MRFIDFIIKTPVNKRYLLIALLGIVIEFVVFKLLYPFADFFSDSYYYIYGAAANLNINIWPIGYSKFLRLFHFLTHSDTALVAFQYFFLELTCLYFFFSILYLYKPLKSNQVLLFVFLFFNPLFLYISNYINSDPLFAALSMWWFTELIWIIERPKGYQIIVQAMLLFLCFTVRNNAYYYPIVAILAFVLSRQTAWKKISGALLGIALIIPFILFTREAAYKLTGTRQFSLFTGWQLANNALYMYGHIQVDNSKLPTPEAKEIDTLAKYFYRYVKLPQFEDILNTYAANFFIVEPKAPLKRYVRHHYRPTSKLDAVADWGRASAAFESFGKYLITHYPFSYSRYFIIRNTKNYFIPPLEKLGIYNLGEDKVDPLAAQWFDYKTVKVAVASKDLQSRILYIFPIVFALLNFYCIGGALLLFVQKKIQLSEIRNYKNIVLACVFLMLNMLFCITTTIIVMRYEFFPMIVCLTLSIVLLEKLNGKEVLEYGMSKNAQKSKKILLPGH